MIIENNKVVSVCYKLTSVCSETSAEFLIEETTLADPLVFLFGRDEVLENFEHTLAGQTKGFKFDFYVESENGYGEYDEEKIAEIPLAAFKDEDGTIDFELISVGNFLPMVDDNGNKIEGEILEVTDNVVIMDFNHSLAGEKLHYVGEVLNVRTASFDEISHGHVHGAGGHHH